MAQTTFAQRLTQACDDNTAIPEYGKGRQVVIAKRLKVSQEAVRKWFAGEAVPKQGKMKELADFLEADEAWLTLGVEPELDRTAKRTSRRIVEGAVNIFVGMITIEGGQCAFPGEKDPRSAFVDFYAIMRGTQMAVHVSVGREVSKDRFEFIIPREHSDVRCVGFIHLGPGRFHMLEMQEPTIEEHKARKGGQFSLAAHFVEGKYYCGSDVLPRFRTFGEIV